MKTIIVFVLAFFLAFSFDKLVNPNITPEAKALYQRLIDNYGTKIFSGQTTFNYDYFVSQTGSHPIIRGFDMQNYSPNNPWYNFQPSEDGTVPIAIDWYLRVTKQQGIVTFFWHWFSPINGWSRTSTFYTSNTDFNVTKATIQGTAEYNATIRDIDAIAVQLKKLQANKIPVLWRPLHEAGGAWFWWGAQGACSSKKLYHIMYERLTNYHKINNLIWIWSTPEPDWYPGNERVDMIGYDSYPGNYIYDCQATIYNQLNTIVGGKKLIAMTENGPIPDLTTCFSSNIKWSFFMTWSDLPFYQNTLQHIKDMYALSITISLPSTTFLAQVSLATRSQSFDDIKKP